MSVHAHEVKLSYVLRPRCSYTVPIYQRRYEWRVETRGGEEIGPLADLWEDIRTADDRKSAGQQYVHFFGPLVVIKMGESEDQYFLVDGQQRLTTVLLFVRAIRDAAQKHGCADIVARADGFLLNGSPGQPNDLRLKLVPSDEDRRDLLPILGLGTAAASNAEEPGLIPLAFQWLSHRVREHITGWTGDAVFQRLDQLLEVLTNRFQMVAILIDGDDYAYEIFHSLNTKGTDLRESDKVKNYCFMKMRPLGNEQLHEIHTQLWRPMAADCSRAHLCARGGKAVARATESEKVDRFLLLWLWVAWRGDFGSRQVYGEFKRFLESQIPRTPEKKPDVSQEPLAARRILVELKEEYAPAFACLANLDLLARPDEVPLRTAIARLRHLGCGEDADYLLLEVLRNYLQWNRPVQPATQALQTITSYYVWRRLCGVSTKAHNRIFSTVARQLRTERRQGSLGTMQQFADRLAQVMVQLGQSSDDNKRTDDRWPDPERDLKHQCIVKGIYNNRNADFLKHVLWYVEKGGMNSEPDGSLSIEHIFPEKGDNWRAELGDDLFRSMDDRKHCLANLTLLEEDDRHLQARAGNNRFSDKRTVYADSGIQLTRDLCACDTWDSTQLNRRANLLAQRIAAVWPRPNITGAADA